MIFRSPSGWPLACFKRHTDEIARGNHMKVAAVQMGSGASVSENVDHAGQAIAEAVGKGADLVLLPEYWSFIGVHDADKVTHGETPGDGLMQNFLSRTAEREKVWIIGGTIPLASPG